MTKRKVMDSEMDSTRKIKRGRKRENTFILEVSSEHNLPELSSILQKYDLHPIILQPNLLEVEYKKTQNVLILISKINDEENFAIHGSYNNFKHFIAKFQLKKLCVEFDEIDLKIKLETELLIVDANIKISNLDNNRLEIEHDKIKEILEYIKNVFDLIEINPSTYRLCEFCNTG